MTRRTTPDPALRRVPSADFRSPWIRPERLDGAPGIEEVRAARAQQPPRLLWDERSVSHPASRQLRVDVPLVGWFTAPDFAYRLGERLRAAWVDVRATDGPRILSVAAHVAPVRGRRCLILLVTTDATSAHTLEAHEARLQRDLEDAIARASRMRGH